MANSLTHALPYPIKNARFTLPLSFRVSAGTPTDPTTPDTEFSSDGGATFADCAEEITTGGANGMGYLTLTGAETNNNTVLIAAKSANCVTTPAILYPRVLPIVSSGTLSAGSAGGGTLGTILAYDIAGCFIRTTGGTGGGGTGGANNQARIVATYTQSTGAFTVIPNWETTPDATTTYDVLLPTGSTFAGLKSLNAATPGRTVVVDTAGLIDANTVKIGPTGSGTAQTARDVGGAVPAATAGAAGGLFIAGSNAATTVSTWTATTTAFGNVTAGTWAVSGSATWAGYAISGAFTATNISNNISGIDVTKFGNVAVTGRDIGLSVLLSSGTGTGQISLSTGRVLIQTGTGTGQLDFTSGVVKANVTQFLGTTSAGAAGYAGIDWNAINAPTTTVALSGTTIGTLTTYTGNTPQTGDSFARIGVAGVGLTNLGDTRIANLDATVSSRMATFTLPTNFSSLGISAGGKITGVILVDTLTTYTGDTPQTGDSFARIGATGSGLTTLATAANLATANAALVKIQAADYDTITVSGDVLTLSNGATQTVTASGRVTV